MTSALGDLLTERTQLAPQQLDHALKLQQQSGEPLGSLLVRLGLVAERDLAETLAEQLGAPVVQPAEYPDGPLLPGAISPQFMRQVKAVPIEVLEDRVVVALADPLDRYTLEALSLALGREIEPRVGVISEIESVVQRQYGDGAGAMAEIVDDLGVGVESTQDLDDVQHLKDLASEAPVVRLVNLVITRALGARASDIHIEPFDGRLQVRYRVDGVLRLVESPPVRSTAAVISRIKVMANLNIAERRLPQDGRIKLRIEGREIDMRISTIPILHGESVVMRILDKGSVPLNFESLGFAGTLLDSFRTVLRRPDGIVLVTGPTGSGKTTTLYAALQTLNTPENKVLTVEDPVEYQLEGVNQIQVKPQIGLTFADALRSILRQDPDVIMVGEMRDLETAKIAVQAALTGHKVFSTLHTNDAASSVTRLLDMGVEDYLVTSTVNGVLAQRLVRTLCHDCKTPAAAPARVVEELRQRGLVAQGDDPVVHNATGCPKCDGIGYRGRSAILELVAMTDALRRAILERGEAMAVREAARADGSEDMHLDGLRKVLAGETSIEEVERVTREV